MENFTKSVFEVKDCKVRCFILALFMTSAIWAVCSRVPGSLGKKPFLITCSIKLVSARNMKMEFLWLEVKSFNGTDSSVIGRKCKGSFIRITVIGILRLRIKS